MQRHKSPYQEYLVSDDWKCKDSPSGAHHWVENRTLHKDHSCFQCVHCREERLFNGFAKKYR